MTQIYIPSKGRHHDVRTLSFISKQWLEKTTLIVHFSEIERYKFYITNLHPQVRIVPHDEIGIENIRRRIGEIAAVEKHVIFFMLDDDFKLYRRKDDESVSLVKQTKEDFDLMMKRWSQLTSLHPVTGVSFRSGNNHLGPASNVSVEYDTRIHGAMGFQTKFFNSIPKFDMPFMEDFAMILWALSQGHTNAKLFYYAYDQVMTNAPGGCSADRTHEKQEQSAKKLHELFPDFVTLVEKENKTGGAFGKRTDVRIAWQKAAKEGRRLLGRTQPA